MTRKDGEARLRRFWRACALGIGGALTLLGCAKILGDFTTSDVQATGTGGSVVNDGGPLRHSSRDMGIPDVSCSEGTKICQGQAVLTCTGGAWRQSNPCTFACVDGSCVGYCVPRTKGCLGSTLVTCTSNGLWDSGVPCTSSVCIGGPGTDAGPAQCLGDCVPGTTQCAGSSTL